MTQPRATDPPTRNTIRPARLTNRPAPGTQVRAEGHDPDIGTVVESDDYYDTLMLRGVTASSQVLIEWPRGGKPVRQWLLVTDLVRVAVSRPEVPGA